MRLQNQKDLSLEPRRKPAQPTEADALRGRLAATTDLDDACAVGKGGYEDKSYRPVRCQNRASVLAGSLLVAARCRSHCRSTPRYRSHEPAVVSVRSPRRSLASASSWRAAREHSRRRAALGDRAGAMGWGLIRGGASWARATALSSPVRDRLRRTVDIAQWARSAAAPAAAGRARATRKRYCSRGALRWLLLLA
jgi:hypothetical protein